MQLLYRNKVGLVAYPYTVCVDTHTDVGCPAAVRRACGDSCQQVRAAPRSAPGCPPDLYPFQLVMR